MLRRGVHDSLLYKYLRVFVCRLDSNKISRRNIFGLSGGGNKCSNTGACNVARFDVAKKKQYFN